jgi:hypothetical protein
VVFTNVNNVKINLRFSNKVKSLFNYLNINFGIWIFVITTCVVSEAINL